MNEWIQQTLGSTPAVLAFDFETAVFIVVVVVSLLGRLFGRKEDPDHGQEWFDGEDDEYARQQKQAAAGDWEEQMRRLLEGEPLQPTSPKEQAPSIVPPPIPSQEEAPPVPIAQPISATVRSSAPVQVVTAEDLRSSQKALEAAKKKAAAAQAKFGRISQSRSRRKPQAQNAVRLLRSPETAQQAIIASVILGKPKGLG